MKRSYPPENPYAPTATTSAAALSRQAVSSRAYPATRSSSPPASTYFTPFDGGHHVDPQPATPEAGAHFAYSTTLRRHRTEGPLGLGTPGSANGFPKLGELRTVVEEEGPSGLWQRTVGMVKGLLSKDEGYEKLATPMTSVNRETPSAIFAHRPVEVRLLSFHVAYVTKRLQDTLAHFGVSPSTGLPSASIPGLLERHGYNEFSVSAPEPLLIKFAKTIYENPLIILLCGSATVSALMGNFDDAMSITIAVLIVLTGAFSFPSSQAYRLSFNQLASYKNNDRRRVSRH